MPPSLRVAEAIERLLRRYAPAAVVRLGYRVGYVALQLLWRVTKPEGTGVKVVVLRGSEVLLVRHTYGRRGWDLPGGGARPGEEFEGVARRELAEELGLEAGPLEPLGPFAAVEGGKRDTLHAFVTRLDDPRPRPDHAEIADLRWYALDTLPVDLADISRRVLKRCAR